MVIPIPRGLEAQQRRRCRLSTAAANEQNASLPAATMSQHMHLRAECANALVSRRKASKTVRRRQPARCAPCPGSSKLCRMRPLVSTLLLGLVLVAGCAADRPPEEITDDGLVRVPSRSVGGVYRAPEASFLQYRRIILEPPSIGFIKDWREKHPEVSQAEFERIRAESVKLFRDEFAREFVKRGPYAFADDPAPDVLLVVPAIEDLDIVAPDSSDAGLTRSYTSGPVTMKVTGDLRDALTGKVVGRVIMYSTDERHPFNEMRLANRTTNAHDQRQVFAKWARLVREALNVAKAERPRTPASKE